MRPAGRHGRGDQRRLEERLRAERPQPSDELVRRLAAELRGARRTRLSAPRLVLAAVVSSVALIALGSVGGIGSAFAAAGKAASSVAKAAGAGTGNKADKITICHATGSATNPYVEIEVAAGGLNGHGGHTGDIVPAPAGGCPDGDTPGEDQYKPGKGCGDKNHVHFKEGKCKKDKEKKNS